MKNANLIGRAFNEGLDDERSLADMKASANTTESESQQTSSPVDTESTVTSSVEPEQFVVSNVSATTEPEQPLEESSTNGEATPPVEAQEAKQQIESATVVETPSEQQETDIQQTEDTNQTKPKPTAPDDLLADDRALTRDELMQIKSSLKQTTILLTEKTWKNIKIKCLEEGTAQVALLSTAMYQVFVRKEIDLDPELIDRFATMFDRHRK